MQLDWANIDHVLLDMDGTLLDLSFDHFFWVELIPETFAQANGITRDEAEKHLNSIFEKHAGTLPWYCLDFWSETLGFDVAAIKREHKEKIAIRPGTLEFLNDLKAADKQIIMATNAHPSTLEIKLGQVPIGHHFNALISSHDLGFAKEDQRFWVALCKQQSLDPARCLFVDDSFAVLESAQRFGIGHLICVTQPSSQHPIRNISRWQTVNYLNEVQF